MPDGFDSVNANYEQGQEIIDWAVSAAANMLIMNNVPNMVNSGEEALDSILEGLGIAIANMPGLLMQQAVILANESLTNAYLEEQAVEELREDIEDL